tara:strand:- start:343 stop:795 length:453 start_codon:yes stop_codon:yes gene_type:complete
VLRQYLAGLAAVILLQACSVSGPANTDAEPVSREGAGLAGSRWQLVAIQFMNDTALAPDDAAKYTLDFGADGRAAMRADCNRGSGSWQSAAPGQLGFGPIAATRAMCPPASISDRYLAQFEWVRSYVLRDGRLYLATEADGAILEFAPAP